MSETTVIHIFELVNYFTKDDFPEGENPFGINTVEAGAKLKHCK